MENLNMFSCYESYETEIKKSDLTDDDKRFLLLQYSILFRHWGRDEGKLKPSEEDLEKKAFIPYQYDVNTISWKRDEKLSLRDIFEWNADYYNAVQQDAEVNKSSAANYYTDIVTDDGNSIIEKFFLGHFPVLDIKQYSCQMDASRKLFMEDESKSFHLVFDEVGTGKTVTALYCIRNVLERKKDESKILIICPNNKKNEWQSDIRRQLGMYAHVVDNDNEKNVFKGMHKKLFFYSGEPCIFIEGQKKGHKNDDLDNWDSEEKWDLIVIDEGHLCFKNYWGLKAEKAVLLTATPVVVNASDEGYSIDRIRELKDYITLLKNITDDKSDIRMNNLFSVNDYFSQYFREDLGIRIKNRNIQFEKCERWEKREEYLYVLSDVKGGMTRLLYEQDDEYLIHGIYEKFNDEITNNGYLLDEKPDIDNQKYCKLKEILSKDKKDNSYIIFFNCIWPAKNIYKKLTRDFAVRDVIIAFRFGGKEMEIYPKDPEANIDNLFDYLQMKIREKKRVIFLTTGASGGTGLNLGDFHGVINYELPFSCIELEQRFGRVDRMDKSDSDQKEMIFLINEDYNPMLRYSTIKLHVTATRMPIRNTVLFSPEFIKANNQAFEVELSRVLEGLSKEDITAFIKVIGSISSPHGKKMADEVLLTLEKKKETNEMDADTEELSDLYSLLEKKDSLKEIILPSFRIYRNFPILKEEITRWRNIITNKEDDRSIDELAASYEIVDEPEEFININNNENISNENIFRAGNQLTVEKKKESEKASEYLVDSIHEYFEHKFESDYKVITDMLAELHKYSESKIEQKASGVFFISVDNNKPVYHRQTVKELRDLLKKGI